MQSFIFDITEWNHLFLVQIKFFENTVISILVFIWIFIFIKIMEEMFYIMLLWYFKDYLLISGSILNVCIS